MFFRKQKIRCCIEQATAGKVTKHALEKMLFVQESLRQTWKHRWMTKEEVLYTNKEIKNKVKMTIMREDSIVHWIIMRI